MMVNADGFPVSDFFAYFAGYNVGFALVHAKLADFHVKMENVCYLHRRVQKI